MIGEDMTRLTVSLPTRLKEKTKAKAEYEGRTMSDIVVEAFVDYTTKCDMAQRLELLEEEVAALRKERKK